MPPGPKGEKRSADVIVNVVWIADGSVGFVIE
jgi:hypothetical protein